MRLLSQAAFAVLVTAGGFSAAMVPVEASGQDMVFSFTGQFTDINAEHRFFLSTSNTIGSNELSFINYAGSGGTNRFGTSFTGNGFRSRQQLLNGGAPIGSQSYDAANLDSTLTTFGAQSGATLRHDLFASSLGTDGRWAMDIVGPANRLTLDSFSPSFSNASTITSMAMFTESGGSTTFTNTSNLNVAGTLNISRPTGSNGSATFTVGSGTTTFNNTVAVHTGGTLNATAGTFNANNGILINGGTLNANPANFNLPTGPSLDAINQGQVNFTGSYNLAGGRTFMFEDGADFTTTSQFLVGNNSNGTLIADGVGSTLNLNTGGSFNEIAIASATGVVTVRNGAALLSDSSSFGIARSSTNVNTSGTLNVESGASAILNNINIGNLNGNASTGILNVTGTGSVLTQNGSSFLNLGNADTPGNAGIHTINVENGGVYNTATGTTTIRKTGTLNILSGGTFNANGNVNIIGGSLVRNGGAFTLAEGKTLTASDDAQVQFIGSNNLSQNKTLTVNSGADVSFTSFFDVGNSSTVGTGTVIVDGPGSTLSTNTTGSTVVDWGSNGSTGNITVRNGGTLNIQGNASLRMAQSGSTSVSTVNVESGGQLNVNGIFLGNSTAGGTANITVTGAGSGLNQSGTSTLTLGAASGGSGQVTVADGGNFVTGTGQTTINTTGRLQVNTGGIVDILGDFSTTGTIGMELDPINEFNFILVNGTATLAGTLDLSFASGYTPTAGDSFFILNAGNGISGTFDQIIAPTISGLTFTPLYDAVSLTIEVSQATLLGDYNNNGTVDAADYTIWQDNFNSTTSLAADGNGDGIINAADYTVWQDNFGSTSATAVGMISIPEPGSLLLLLVLSLPTMARRHGS